MTRHLFPDTAGQLYFKFSDWEAELRALADVAEPFLDCPFDVLAAARERLNSIRQMAPGVVRRWGIDPAAPVRTRASDEIQHQGRGDVTAEVCATYDISPMGPHGTGRYQTRVFALGGIASVRVVLKNQDGVILGVWRNELGDTASPGCFFHTQILGQDEALPFPKSLSIPRLPGICVTLPATIEFVLGELFQAAWPEHVCRETRFTATWAETQRPLLDRVLSWKSETVRSAQSSPWIALKRRRPSAYLFCD
jgi:hypothetical protein